MSRCSLTLLLVCIEIAAIGVARAQDTFSLIAYDAATGEVLSAGGSCIDGDAIAGGAAVISTVVPGVGAVHTQGYFHADNKAVGARLLVSGLSAKRLLDSLVAADVSLTPAFRQYAALTLDGDAAAVAAYTGTQTSPWAGQRLGDGYVLAGNILLDSTVLRGMETAFVEARGRGASLRECGAAALGAVAFPGADRRCLSAGLSCRSAFLRLARPGDSADSLSLDLRVVYPTPGEDPIVTLLGLLPAERGGPPLPR